MFIEFNPNPCARSVGDCAVRAISAALNVGWEEAYQLLADAGMRMCDMMNSNAVIDAVLRQSGFYKEAIPSFRHDCYTVDKFCRDNPVGTYVLGFGTHVATVIDGDLFDAWDSSREIPVYFWTR